MENSSNLTILINLLINGMFIVFSVLTLVYFIGKSIIRVFSKYKVKGEIKSNIEKIIDVKIKKISKGKGKIISYKKI